MGILFGGRSTSAEREDPSFDSFEYGKGKEWWGKGGAGEYFEFLREKIEILERGALIHCFVVR